MDTTGNGPDEWGVVFTSYRPGEAEAARLSMRVPPPSGASSAPRQSHTRIERGELVEGDPTLPSGEYRDTYEMRFTPGVAVQVRLESSDFDTFLMLRGPSGVRQDNDEHEAGSTHSGIDIPLTEEGTYTIAVTSVSPGATGRYRLTVSERPAEIARPAGSVWGLFIGISDYPGTRMDLKGCADDARRMAETLQRSGAMPPEQAIVLTDAEATRANVRAAMERVASVMREDDVFVFFYSGHGGQTEQSEDPRELDGRDEFLLLYDGRLVDDELGQLFEGIEGLCLVVIDACHSGGFAKDVITRPGIVGLFSSEEDTPSGHAGHLGAGGYLAHFLRIGLEGEADQGPHDGVLRVGELTHYVWMQFAEHAKDMRLVTGYQHFVVDRGAVPRNALLWQVRS